MRLFHPSSALSFSLPSSSRAAAREYPPVVVALEDNMVGKVKRPLNVLLLEVVEEEDDVAAAAAAVAAAVPPTRASAGVIKDGDDNDDNGGLAQEDRCLLESFVPMVLPLLVLTLVPPVTVLLFFPTTTRPLSVLPLLPLLPNNRKPLSPPPPTFWPPEGCVYMVSNNHDDVTPATLVKFHPP